MDSDLDWKDLYRLRESVRARGITHLALAYYGSTDHARETCSWALRPLSQHRPDTGWVAISETYYWMGTIERAGNASRIDTTAYRWLRRMKPVATVGSRSGCIG